MYLITSGWATKSSVPNAPVPSDTKKRRFSTRKDAWPERSPQKPWTAARCNRLLRPLVSKLAAISTSTKLEGAVGRVEQEDTKSIDLPPFCNIGECFAYASSSESSQIENDSYSEWAPLIRRKHLKRKYRRRSSPKSRVQDDSENTTVAESCSQPGEIIVPTPLVNKRLPRVECSPTYCGKPTLQDAFRHAERPIAGKHGKKRYLPRATIQDGMLHALDTLLEATSDKRITGHVPTAIGASSLFNMCLRAVPGHIAEEQQRRSLEDSEDRSDVSAEVYHMLEDLAPLPNQGWASLRQVAKAHGVFLICEGLRTRSLVVPIDLILHILLKNGAYNEAELALSSYLLNHEPFEMPVGVDDGISLPAALLRVHSRDNFAAASVRYGFQYRILSDMLISRVVPVEWFATSQFQSLWRRVIRSISEMDNDYGYAANLAEVTVRCACDVEIGDPNLLKAGHHDSAKSLSQLSARFSSNRGKHGPGETDIQNALNNTVLSLCTILSTIAIISHAFDNGKCLDNFAQLAIRVIRSASVRISQHYGHDKAIDLCSRPEVASRAITVLMADVVLVQNIEKVWFSSNILEDRIACIMRLSATDPKRLETSYEGAASILCTIARCCGHAEGKDGFEVFRRLINQSMLQSHAGNTICQKTSNYMKQIAIEAATSFAYQSGDAKHAAFARLVEEMVIGQVALQEPEVLSTPRGARPSSKKDRSFRWEEGICEWIAATPASFARSKRCIESISIPCYKTCPSPLDERIHEQFEGGSHQNRANLGSHFQAISPSTRKANSDGLRTSQAQTREVRHYTKARFSTQHTSLGGVRQPGNEEESDEDELAMHSVWRVRYRSAVLG